MTTITYADVLQVARQLPLGEQAAVAEELMRNLRTALRGSSDRPVAEELSPLTGMSTEELEALAAAVVASGHQQQLEELLEKNRRGALTSAELTELDDLLAKADQVALLKARAKYTLGMSGLQPRRNL
jgi:hypothetical protein